METKHARFWVLSIAVIMMAQAFSSCCGTMTENTQTSNTTTIEITTTVETEPEKDMIYESLDHFYIDRTFKEGTLENVEVTTDGLKLTDGATEGTFVSADIPASKLHSLCGSFSGQTSTDATVELTIALKINGTYSKYFSYGEWGLGRRNKCVGQSDNNCKMSLDEIMVSGIDYCEGCKVKLILRRTSSAVESPTVRLYSLALELLDYKYAVDTSSLPDEVKYDVPKYNQGRVPEIGGIICSPSTSAMLLGYKGISTKYNAENKDYPAYKGFSRSTLNYNNGSFAALCNDFGNEIYGNWSYNVMCMGAFGADAYVKRFYSLEELIETVAKVGPVGVSTKGYISHSGRSWQSGGHLMVVTGYKYKEDGSLLIYMNDPSFSGVECTITEKNFNAINRNVCYVIE